MGKGATSCFFVHHAFRLLFFHDGKSRAQFDPKTLKSSKRLRDEQFAELVVSTQKNMSQNGFIFPKDRGENKKQLKPTPRTKIVDVQPSTYVGFKNLSG